MIKDYFSLAFGNLRHRGIRSWLTVLGVFIGIAAVVSLISLGAGLQSAITAQFSSLSVDRLIVENTGTGFGPPGSTAVRTLTSHDVDLIASVSGVDNVISRILRIVKTEYNDALVFEYIITVPPTQKGIDFAYDSSSLQMDSGRFLKSGESGKIVIGADIADGTLNGFDKDIQVGSNLILQGKKFQVSGILKKAGSFQINQVIIIPENDLKDLLHLDDEADLIIVQVTDKNKIEQVASVIKEKLRRDRNEKLGEEDFSVQTPTQSLGTVNTILSIINYVVAGIAAISLLIGGIGITNTMYTSVLERTREIGVMKAIGAQNKDVLAVFVIESGLLGLVGGIVGALIGLGMAFAVAGIANTAFHDQILSVSVSFPLLLSAIAFALLIGIAAGLLPAFQASKLKPVEALRK